MLTERQRRFAYQVIATGDKMKAAEFVGIDEATADDWLKNAAVLAAIDHDTRAAVAVAGETRETILARLINIANGDLTEYFVPGSGWQQLKDLDELTPEQRKRIKKVEWTQHGPRIELHDPVRVTIQIAEMTGYFTSVAEDEKPEDLASKLRELADAFEQVTSGNSAD